MLRNEKGFTFLEGIVSLSLVLLVTVSLFPLLSIMLGHLKEGEKEMAAYRLMYEHAEKQAASGSLGAASIVLRDTVFELYMEENDKGDWKVCAGYEETTICID